MTIRSVPAEKTQEAKRPGRRGRPAVRLTTDPAKVTSELGVGETAVDGSARRMKRGDDVKARILQAALDLFGAYGFEGTTTRAVAERAGVTHTLILYHFQSKDQLWIATMDDALSKYTASMREQLAKTHDRPASEGLRTFIEEFVRMSARWPQIHRIMTMEGNHASARLQWVIDTYLRNHFTLVRNLIRRAQDEGTVRMCDAGRLYYHIIGAGGTPFTIATEYMQLTGRDVFSEAEIYRNIAFIFELVFI